MRPHPDQPARDSHTHPTEQHGLTGSRCASAASYAACPPPRPGQSSGPSGTTAAWRRRAPRPARTAGAALGAPGAGGGEEGQALPAECQFAAFSCVHAAGWSQATAWLGPHLQLRWCPGPRLRSQARRGRGGGGGGGDASFCRHGTARCWPCGICYYGVRSAMQQWARCLLLPPSAVWLQAGPAANGVLLQAAPHGCCAQQRKIGNVGCGK